MLGSTIFFSASTIYKSLSFNVALYFIQKGLLKLIDLPGHEKIRYKGLDQYKASARYEVLMCNFYIYSTLFLNKLKVSCLKFLTSYCPRQLCSVDHSLCSLTGLYIHVRTTDQGYNSNSHPCLSLKRNTFWGTDLAQGVQLLIPT